MQAQQLSKCTTKFYQNIQGKLTWNQKWEYESIDKEIMLAKLTAEKMCWKIKAGNYRWTPETTAIQAVLYWKELTKCKNGGKVGKQLLKRQGTKGIPH